jgi:PAS domain S-box-containing protein
MKFINFKKANCKNCYKCVRVCPIKAIRIRDEQAGIMENACILCGKCLKACPQNAKSIRSDIDRVKHIIKESRKVVASLAPSFIGAFELKEPGQIVGALKALGFAEVQETALGAVYVSRVYRDLMQQGRMENIISSACPTVNELIEKYYPEVIPYLAPVVSPMIAHGKLIKESSGWDTKVVFIGPCISKKMEAEDFRHEGVIDAVLTFDELLRWFKQENIRLEEQEALGFDGDDPDMARYYPVPRGILRNLKQSGEDFSYHAVSVDGIEQCIEVLEALKVRQLKGYFIEMNACEGGCLRGPAMPSSMGLYLKQMQKVREYADKNSGVGGDALKFGKGVLLNKVFVDRSINQPIPDEAAIREILKKIGKPTEDQELNCGACGYPSCRDKAIAVYQGKAELYMCLPYMRERAESLANVILKATPNIIIAVNGDMEIQEFNDAAERMFQISRETAIGRKLYQLIDTSDFERVWETHESIFGKKVEYKEYGVVTEQDIMYVEDQQLVMAIMRDITNEERQARQMYKIKAETVEMAQKVIDKQMMVVQQIASLLGETTAETKVTLTRLKDMILYDREDGR